MKKSDFIEIHPEHFATCELIIAAEGACNLISCDTCPFTYGNAKNHNNCDSNGYRKHSVDVKDSLCKEKAEEFKKLYKRLTSTFLTCKHCGGYIKYIKHKESYLDREGYVISSDVDEVQFYKCDNCKCESSDLKNLVDMLENEEE